MKTSKENDLLKYKIQYGVWLGELTVPQLRALASQVGLRDWLSLSESDLVNELKEHGKAQTIWARSQGLVADEIPLPDGEAT